MIAKESFLGRSPSHFQLNEVVRAFISSEVFLWSAWNLFTPIIALFAATQIKGGNIEIAASSTSVYMIVRVVIELISGKFLVGSSEHRRFLVIIAGISIMSTAYFGLAFTSSILQLFIFYGLFGIAMGIMTPARMSLFSTHLDKKIESAEWSFHDAAIFISMALSAALGWFIAHSYGFRVLFIVGGFVNLIAIVPYLLYLTSARRTKTTSIT